MSDEKKCEIHLLKVREGSEVNIKIGATIGLPALHADALLAIASDFDDKLNCVPSAFGEMILALAEEHQRLVIIFDEDAGEEGK